MWPIYRYFRIYRYNTKYETIADLKFTYDILWKYPRVNFLVPLSRFEVTHAIHTNVGYDIIGIEKESNLHSPQKCD